MKLIDQHKTPDTYITAEPVIVGVGASAGGLEALYALFERPIPFNVSFVVIQHLSPDFKSITAELLASHSHQRVIAIEDNMFVEGNSIYVLTERKKIEMKEGRLLLTEPEPTSVNNAMDIFFDSLAAEQGSKSICIILSGKGSDGTIGAAAIKKAGGIVIVQDPETAQFGTMPANVIAAGCADSIVAPIVMIDEISGYLKQNTLMSQFTDNNEALLIELLELVSKHTPLDFSTYKRATIVRRIIRKMIQSNVSLLSDFIEFLKNHPSEIDALSKEFMISVTKFFRDPEAFEFLKQKALPDILSNKEPNNSLKIWVIGCATGEEAYSIAILIHELLEETKKTMEVKIFASDIDKDALAVASKGIYPESIAGDISEERLTKYFYKEGGKYKIKEPIRNMLIIAQHDITKNPPYYKLDLITCRNLLIYLNPILQKKILATLHYCLNPGGYMFLGPSESIGDLKTKLSEEDKKWKIYKNVEPARRLENGIYTTPSFFIKPPPKAMPVLRTATTIPPDSLYEIVAETLSHKNNEAGVCVDGNYKILKTFGDYKKYLLPEMFTFNLLDVLPPELSIATATGLKQAMKEKKALTIKEVLFIQNNLTRSVSVYIKPIQEYKPSESVMLISFTEEALKDTTDNIEIFSKELHTNRYLINLEEELKDTQKKLNESYDALDNCNTYAQSFSEELISGNEELQSTNEEVQSVNEELHTINNQYQAKIKEIVELNDDLNNYFRSTVNGHIYVDNKFIIRKFTPSAVKQVNVKESDIGRPISDISTNIKFSTMMEDIRSVISSSVVIEKEVETMDNKWYQMRLLPYVKQQNNSIGGVIVSFNDITDLKTAQRKLIKINEDHNTFIYSASHDLKAPASNIEALSKNLYEMIEPDKEEMRDVANMIMISTAKLKETISELADITKIEKEASEELVETVNINGMLEEVKLSIRDMMVKSNLKINCDFKEEEVFFSKKNFRSILLNLLTNAIKYHSPERELEITINSFKKNNYIILSVEDNGMGIAKERKAKIFSMFERVHKEDGIEGSGIGLYLIKKMMMNAGGKITVESEVGKGSTFMVWFKNKATTL